MNDSFKTIEQTHSCEIKIGRSRFIGTAVPTLNREESDIAYGELRRKFHDATHNCFSYQCGFEKDIQFRYSDDGEPSGTAGRPIYDSILSHQLTNVLVVVTRYFGGIKLGTGGLSRAYRQSADTVLDESKIVERVISQPFRIIFEHELTSVVMKTLSDYNLRTINNVYGDNVTLVSEIRISLFDQFCLTIKDRSRGKANVEMTGKPHV